MMDLTTLEGADTPARVRQMCRKALQPATPALTEALAKIPGFRPIPSVAAVCVYPLLVPHAVQVLRAAACTWPRSRPRSHPGRPRCHRD